jgi:hypothetical protein
LAAAARLVNHQAVMEIAEKMIAGLSVTSLYGHLDWDCSKT